MLPVQRALLAGAIAFASSLALAAPADQPPLLRAVLALCGANRSRPDAVAASAKSAGWTGAMGVGQGSRTIMTKNVDGGMQVLTFFAREITLRTGDDAVFYACQVSGDGSGFAEAVRALMGRGPQLASGPYASEWLFTDRDGRRTFLPDESPGSVAKAIKTAPVDIIRVPPGGGYVEFNEIAPAS
jgi:hypothetical protein